MFRQLFAAKRFSKQGSPKADVENRGEIVTTRVRVDCDLFAKVSDDSVSLLVRYSDSTGIDTILNAIEEDIGQGKASTTSSEKLHGEVVTHTLTLPGYLVAAVMHERTFSRYINMNAELYFPMAHEESQAILYAVTIPSQAEEYLSRRTWEKDRLDLSQMLGLSGLVEHPNKPLLLLVMKEDGEKDDELGLERIVNLLGLGSLRRPFRAVAHSKGTQNNEALKEAFEWLANAVNSKDDESTAAMTGYNTEDDGSVVTSTSTAQHLANGGGHYVLDYEPTLLGGNATLQWFEPIKKGTFCPFARAAKLWGGKLAEEEERPRLWRDSPDEVRRVASLNAGPLSEFVTRSNNGEMLDGFCLFLNQTKASAGLVGQLVRILLTQLADLDPTPGENAMRMMGRIDDPHWRFRFAGEDFFVTTFAPIYEKHSSRYTFGVWKTFVLFQPLASFGRHGLVNDTPASATNWENPTTMRDKARVAFKKNGCPYHIPEELPYPVVEHIVKPEKDDRTSCVRWWEPNASFPE